MKYNWVFKSGKWYKRLENLYREIEGIDIARFEISADLEKYAARRLDPGIGDLAEAIAAVSEEARVPISARVARSETVISRDCKISSQLPRVAAKSPMFADGLAAPSLALVTAAK